MGIGMIEPAQGVKALELALDQDVPQIAVLPMNWSAYLHGLQGGKEPSLFSEIAAAIRAREKGKNFSAKESDFRKQLEKSDLEDRMELLENHIREQVVGTLGLKSTVELKADQGLTDLGMDSLMAVEISNRLKHSLGCYLPSTIVFEHPTLKALTDYLATEVFDFVSAPAARDNPGDAKKAQSNVAREVENLSEEDVERALIQELEDTGY